jgi:hypothetical protein
MSRRRPYNRQSDVFLLPIKIQTHFHGVPLLQKSGETCQGRQIGVSEKFWNFNRDRMNKKEATTLFKCTVCGFHVLHIGGLEVVLPLKQSSSRRWVWMDRS